MPSSPRKTRSSPTESEDDAITSALAASQTDPQDEEGPRHFSARHSAPVPAHALRLAPQPRQSPPSLRAHLQEGTIKQAGCRCFNTQSQVRVVVKMEDN